MFNFEKNTITKMLRTIIVDDETRVRGILRQFLEKYSSHANVIGEAAGVEEAYQLINQKHPDLVLLDIEMADGSGFDLLKRFESPDFKVIFITAHDRYAVQAFKVSAIDFILKPVNPKELARAVEQTQHAVKHELRLKLEALEANLNYGQKQTKKVIIKTLDNIYLLEMDSITHIESEGAYARLYTIDQGEIMASRPLKDYEDMLAGFGFFRIHRSFVINLSHIKRFEKQDGGNIILTGEYKIAVASRKRDLLIKLMDELGK